VIYEFLGYPERYGCPFPCDEQSYEISLKYFHETSWPDFSKPESFNSTFFLVLFYDTFDVVESKETLVYDVGDLFAAAGGHLGLFLGFSCLSVLMQVIDYLILYFNRL
jgi:hypothetical protein